MTPRSMLTGMVFRLQIPELFDYHPHWSVPQAPQRSSVHISNLKKLGNLLTHTHTPHTNTHPSSPISEQNALKSWWFYLLNTETLHLLLRFNSSRSLLVRPFAIEFHSSAWLDLISFFQFLRSKQFVTFIWPHYSLPTKPLKVLSLISTPWGWVAEGFWDMLLNDFSSLIPVWASVFIV